MPTSKYRVYMNNSDRGTSRWVDFSILHDAEKYYNSYKLTPGETIELAQIGVKPASIKE